MYNPATKRKSAWVRIAILCAALALPGTPATATNPAVTVSVDASKSNLGANPVAISPLIYGDNGNSYSDYDSTANFPPTTRTTTAKIPVLRLGGDLFSTYNWQIDAQNHDFTYYFESLSCANSTTPSSTVTTNGQLVDSFIKFCQNTGASPMVTVQMFPYLANLASQRGELDSFPVNSVTGNLINGTAFSQSGFGDQQNEDMNAGNGYGPAGAQLTLTPNTNPPTNIAYIPYVPNSSTIQQNFLTHLTSTYGTAANGGVPYYILDNEPGDWFATHFDAYPTGVHTAQYLSLFNTYSQLVKNADPNALVIAPEDTAWYTYFVSGYDDQTGTDADLFNATGQNGTFYYPYLLSQFKAMSTTAGKRLLDYLSCHYYAQSGDVSSDDDTTATKNLRNQSTRELWDPNYLSPDVPDVTSGHTPYAPQLIPLMKGWISSGYPGTKLAITEYSFGDDASINGATTEADVLGIFGVYGVDLATRYGDQSYTNTGVSFSDQAIQMYRNYDANGAQFGNTSVSDTVPDTEPNPQVTFTGRDNFASYAAIRSSDGALTVMVINKVLSGSTPVTINLSNFSAGNSAQAWQLTSAGAITQLASVTVATGSLSATVPAQSITLFVIPAQATLTAQTITFNPPPTQTYGVTPITLSATATSNLPVSFTVLSGPGSLVGSTLTVTGAGTIQVQASQGGNATYSPAVNVTQNIIVNKASQTITFPTIATQTYPSTAFTISATASSGLTVTFMIQSGSATVAGSTVTLTGTGTVMVQASQAGNADYFAATSMQQSFSVNAATQGSPQTVSQWETTYNITSLTATPEDDDISNLLKYFYDINPNQTMTAADRAALPVFTLDTTTTLNTTYLKLIYREYAHFSGATLNIQTSSDLKIWTTLNSSQYTSQQIGTSVGDSGTTDPIMEIEVPATTTKAFLRLNVTSP